jgi:hypothetical protein
LHGVNSPFSVHDSARSLLNPPQFKFTKSRGVIILAFNVKVK